MAFIRAVEMSNTISRPFVRYHLKKTFEINQDIMGLICHPQNDNQWIDYQSGQYMNVCLDTALHTMLSLSIANRCTDDHYIEFHLRHDSKQMAALVLLEQLKLDPTLYLNGPYGKMTAANIKPNAPLLLLAGGTGIAPFKAILEHLMVLPSLTHSIHLLWGIRKPEDLYLLSFLEEVQQKLSHFNFEIILSDPVPTNITWPYQTGFLDEWLTPDIPDLNDSQIYISGPYMMIQKCYAALLAYGVNPDAITSDMIDSLQV